MYAFVLLLTTIVSAAPVEVKLFQVSPSVANEKFHRSDNCRRAVVLIHGLKIHPLSARKVNAAALHGWQEAGSDLVRRLTPSCDVFALAYSQNSAIEEIAGARPLRQQLAKLKRLGYQEVVLVGNSAGGLVARQLAEDFPEIGITKVIQTGTPNTGSCWACGTIAVCAPQEVFLSSLTEAAREAFLTNRTKCRVPEQTEFVCLVGDLGPYRLAGSVPVWPSYKVAFCTQANPYGDGLVSAESQWPSDLRRQGIPMVKVNADHCEMMYCESAVDAIVKLVQTKQRRWSAAEVEQAEHELGQADRFCCEFGCVRQDDQHGGDE